MRKKAEVEASVEPSSEGENSAAAVAATRCSQTWAMLIKRVYEVDPLSCPQCGAPMKVVAFIERGHQSQAMVGARSSKKF